MIRAERIQQLWHEYSDYTPGWIKHIAFARAIEAEVAAPLEVTIAQQAERIKELEGKWLAELQTENEKLRDENAALALQNKQMREIFQSVMVENSNSPLGTIALWCVSEALALPDLSIPIIQQLDNEVIERCAEVCEKADRYRGDYFAEKLRALKK